MIKLWRMLYALPLRLRSLFRREQVEREMAEEFDFYINARVEEEIARARTSEEARRIAVRALDGRAQRMEECRDARGVRIFENLLRDLRHGGRAWRRTPGVWALATQALALGIGANSTVFSLVDSIYHRPFASLDPTRHALLQNRQAKQARGGNSLVDFLAWRQAGPFELMVATQRTKRALTGAGEPVGATAGKLMRMIVVSGLRLAGLGALLGVVGGILTGRLIASQMVRIHATDLAVLGPACGVFLAVALVACLAPARRAARADVLPLLRQE